MENQGRSSGRGRILQLLKEQKEKQESSSTVGGAVLPDIEEKREIPDPECIPKVGLGRANFLAKIRRQGINPGISQIQSTALSLSSTEKYSTIGKCSYGTSTGEKSVEELTHKLKVATIEKDEPSEECPINKRGEAGSSLPVSVNYVLIQTEPNKGVFEYEIRFFPEIDYISYRFKILHQHFGRKKGIRCYDGGHILFLPEKITDNVMKFTSKHPNDDTPVLMTVKYRKEVKIKDRIQLFNTLFNNCARVMNMTRFKNKFYNHQASYNIPQYKLEVWPGFVTSVDEFDGGLMLQCDAHHKVLRNETPYDILATLSKLNAKNFKTLAEKELLGQCVLTRYNNNTYRIDDIEWNSNPLSTFKLSSGRDISYIDYYKKQYNLDIKDLKQPLLINRKKNEKGEKTLLICLIPELCYMTGLTDKMKTDMKVMKDISLYTRITPVQRDLAFKKFLNNIINNKEASEMLHEWGLKISEEPLNITGRILPPETILFGKNKVFEHCRGDWQKCLRDVSVIRSKDILTWLFIYPRKEERVALTFSNNLKKTGPGLGIEINEPKSIPLPVDKTDAYIEAIKSNLDDKVQIVVCLCPTSRDDRYSAIKKFCCKEAAIPSQIVLSSTLNRDDRLRSVVQNIALQMNNKLGGASWAIKIPFQNTMVCGVDTYHSDLRGGNSVGGFVASTNLDYTEWFSRVIIQGPKQELICGFIQSFSAALKIYLTKNLVLPERIIVFRDGVGTGQISTCQDFEVNQFLKACSLVCPNYEPKFTFVIVHKRINTRFFEVSDITKMNNPPPGSIIDNTITKKKLYDFFLVSQYVRHGTATPSHYIIIYDNSDIKPDHIQRLTYKFCHLYYNWPGTIRVPAPCQYAHKLSYLIGESVKAMPDASLENKLYYL